MTMPHLMNCPHITDGWCLECVGKARAEREAMRLALVAAFPLLRRIRDRVDAVQFFEANAVMGQVEAALAFDSESTKDG